MGGYRGSRGNVPEPGLGAAQPSAVGKRHRKLEGGLFRRHWPSSLGPGQPRATSCSPFLHAREPMDGAHRCPPLWPRAGWSRRENGAGRANRRHMPTSSISQRQARTMGHLGTPNQGPWHPGDMLTDDLGPLTTGRTLTLLGCPLCPHPQLLMAGSVQGRVMETKVPSVTLVSNSHQRRMSDGPCG